MKGFIRILEAIISSLILIAVLPFFLVQPSESEWGNIALQTNALDTLAVLQKTTRLETYVKNNDVAALNSELIRLLPKAADFSVEVSGIPNPVILVGCVCTSTEIDDLENLLWPLNFQYKERQISIRVSNMTMNTVDPRTRVLFIFGYLNLTPYKSILTQFLESGGTIFMFTDLTSSQTQDGILNTTFGLKWNAVISSGGSASFFVPGGTTKISHKVSRYYENISGRADTGTFSGLGDSSINRIEIDNKTVIFSSQVSLVKANDYVSKNGKGRTIWFANYGYTLDNDAAQRLKNLTKATIMWASGENYKMDPFTKRPAQRFLEATHIGQIDGVEPFEIKLVVWRPFS